MNPGPWPRPGKHIQSCAATTDEGYSVASAEHSGLCELQAVGLLLSHTGFGAQAAPLLWSPRPLGPAALPVFALGRVLGRGLAQPPVLAAWVPHSRPLRVPSVSRSQPRDWRDSLENTSDSGTQATHCPHRHPSAPLTPPLAPSVHGESPLPPAFCRPFLQPLPFLASGIWEPGPCTPGRLPSLCRTETDALPQGLPPHATPTVLGHGPGL